MLPFVLTAEKLIHRRLLERLNKNIVNKTSQRMGYILYVFGKFLLLKLSSDIDSDILLIYYELQLRFNERGIYFKENIFFDARGMYVYTSQFGFHLFLCVCIITLPYWNWKPWRGEEGRSIEDLSKEYMMIWWIMNFFLRLGCFAWPNIPQFYSSEILNGYMI